eukprot:6886047-Ditylum_brightwellii.AAC.1
MEVVNMVAEDIQQAMKNPPSTIFDEHQQETANLLVEKNANMQQKLDIMYQLIKQFQEQMRQAPPSLY